MPILENKIEDLTTLEPIATEKVQMINSVPCMVKIEPLNKGILTIQRIRTANQIEVLTKKLSDIDAKLELIK